MELQLLGYTILLVLIFILIEYYRLNKNRLLNTEQKDHYIYITDKEFQFKSLDIKVGDKVIWRNMSNLRHNISSNYENIPNSPLLLKFDSYSFRFNKKGSFVFFSSLYPEMEKLMINVN